MIRALQRSGLGIQILMMNDDFIRFQIFKNHPYDMSFFIDLTLDDVDDLVLDLKNERDRLKKASKV